MSVILHLDTGDKVRLDRNLRPDQVMTELAKLRGRGHLAEFPNDATPSDRVWVDVDNSGDTMSRTHREFHYTNEDGQDGMVSVGFGPWGGSSPHDAPIMVSFDDACWMGVEQADEFTRWFRVALAEAKRKHRPREDDDAPGDAP